MNPKHRKYKIFIIFIFVSLIIIFCWFILKEVRLNHLNRTLISAVKSGNVILVRAALAQGADPNSRDTGDRTNTQLISDCVARLLGKKFQASEKAPCSLFLAVSSERESQAIINDLLKYGADPNARGDYYEADDHVPTLILYCAVNGDQEAIQLLAKAGADVNVTDEDGRTTLNLICYYANAKTVQVLLDKGANPNIKDKSGETPLLSAVDGWNAKVVKLLIQHGAEKNIATSWSASNPVLQKHIDALLRLADHSRP